MKAHGAVAYFKQDKHTSLIMSKTKVSPLKTISLPRLELYLPSDLPNSLSHLSNVNVLFRPQNRVALDINSSKQLNLSLS